MADREAMLDTIYRAYDARGKGDIEGLMGTFHPDAVFELKGDKAALDVAGAVHGHSNVRAALSGFIEGFELPTPNDIADAIAFAIAAPLAVNISNMEILPTLQVPGGLTTIKREPARQAD